MSTGSYLKISFERFNGNLFPENGRVEFGGMIFNDAYQAIQVLREVMDCDQIVSGFMHRGVKGLVMDDGRVITVNKACNVRTFGSAQTAKMSINVLKRRGQI